MLGSRCVARAGTVKYCSSSYGFEVPNDKLYTKGVVLRDSVRFLDKGTYGDYFCCLWNFLL